MAKEKDTVTVFYMPLPGDPVKTVCNGVELTAYEATEVPAHKGNSHHFSGGNPGFTTGDIDEERQDKWEKYQKARADYEKAKETIEAFEKAHKG